MGLVTGVLTLPIAPLRGLLWLAGHIEDRVRAEHDPTVVIRRQLEAAEQALAEGAISEDECADIQDELLARLLECSAPRSAWEMTG